MLGARRRRGDPAPAGPADAAADATTCTGTLAGTIAHLCVNSP